MGCHSLSSDGDLNLCRCIHSAVSMIRSADARSAWCLHHHHALSQLQKT